MMKHNIKQQRLLTVSTDIITLEVNSGQYPAEVLERLPYYFGRDIELIIHSKGIEAMSEKNETE